jgi:surface protein
MRRPPSTLTFVPWLLALHVAASSVIPLTNDNIQSTLRLWHDTDDGDRALVEELYGGPIAEWDVSGITALDEAFADTDSFEADLSQWDVSRVTSMRAAFYNTTLFAANVATWDVSNVVDMRVLLAYSTDFLSDISMWNPASLQNLRAAFVEYMSTSATDAVNHDSPDTLPISNWKTPSLTDMEGMFAGTYHFHVNLSGWDTSKVTSMSFMLENSVGFYGGDLSLLDTSNVETMERMFAQAVNVRGAKDVTLWDTSNLFIMDQMFFNTTVTMDDGDSDAHLFYLCWDLTGVDEDALEEAFCHSNAGGFDCECVPENLVDSINRGCNTTQKTCFDSLTAALSAAGSNDDSASSAFPGMNSIGWGQLLAVSVSLLLLVVDGV